MGLRTINTDRRMKTHTHSGKKVSYVKVVDAKYLQLTTRISDSDFYECVIQKELEKTISSIPFPWYGFTDHNMICLSFIKKPEYLIVN